MTYRRGLDRTSCRAEASVDKSEPATGQESDDGAYGKNDRRNQKENLGSRCKDAQKMN